MADSILISDVEEALRLIEVSKSSLIDDDGKNKRRTDPNTIIFNLIKEMSTKANGGMIAELPISNILERVISKGLSEKNLDECLELYERDDVWFRSNDNLEWMRINDDEDDE